MPTATITITCPQCKAQLRGPAELRGRKVSCKKCGKSFVISPNMAAAPASGAKQPPPVSRKSASAARGPAAPSKGRPAAPSPPPPSTDGPNAYTFISDEEALAQMQQFQEANRIAGEVRPHGYANADGGRNPYGVEEMDLQPRCPHCAKEMDPDAIVCLHCGYNTQTRVHAKIKRTFENTSEDRFKWWLPGILCLVVCGICIGFICFAWLALDSLADQNKEAWWTFIDGLWFKVWGSVGAAGLTWVCGKFAYHRLILHREPPEVEKK